MIYLDNNATTQVDERVIDAMAPFLVSDFANPSSPYSFARRPALALATAREQLASVVHAPSDSLTFTSGGTESNNLAVLGSLPLHPGERTGILISAVEHPAIRNLEPVLTARGYQVNIIPVHNDGSIDLSAYQALCTPTTALVCMMLANNETGILYPVRTMAEMAHTQGARLHTDAVQALGKWPVEVDDLGADSMSLCAHKLHGPKGIGALYVRKRGEVKPLMYGGDQEQALRPGTENVAGAVGLGLAADFAEAERETTATSLAASRDQFEHDILAALEGVRILGQTQPRLPNTSMLVLEGLETEPLLIRLDMDGICASSGSACSSGAHEPSPGLAAMGFAETGQARLRFSASRMNHHDDFSRASDALIRAVRRLRS